MFSADREELANWIINSNDLRSSSIAELHVERGREELMLHAGDL